MNGEPPLDDVCDLHLKIVLSQCICAASCFGPSMAGEGKKADGAEGEAGRWSTHSGLQPSPLGWGWPFRVVQDRGHEGPDPCLLSWTMCSFESSVHLRLHLPAPRNHFAQGHLFLHVGDEKLQTPNSEARRLLGVGGGCRYEPGKLHLGVWTRPGGSWSLSHLPPPLHPQWRRWPQRVCAPLGWNATASDKVLSRWPAGVNVCLSSSPWAPAAEARPGILCFNSRVCGGPSGPFGLQVGSGGWAPPAHPQVRWDQGSAVMALGAVGHSRVKSVCASDCHLRCCRRGLEPTAGGG